METITISKLKAQVSAVLARVRGGATVPALDRQTPVAVLTGVQPSPALVVSKPAEREFSPPEPVRVEGTIGVDELLLDRRRRG